jgi:hypothetical protein
MTLKEKFRNLTFSEAETLKHNGCSCEDWSRVRVKDGFNPNCCKNVIFSGDINLGVFKEQVTDESGVTIPCGILNARLHNCTIGSNVIINNIGDYIANYIIEDKVVIRNCGRIHTEGITSFGNGTSVSVLIETGGRAVKIWDRLSAHEAYIIALYRHRSKAVDIIEKLVDDYAVSCKSGIGTIGYNSRILNCNSIRNVRFAPYSQADGALTLNEGTVNSCEADKVFIGPGVIMEHFIVCSGSTVTESAIIDKCFIGQGCVLAKQFSAENSLFFANCAGYHGETCSVFAGPYTVTHHKSTLLIAGYFSFMNAGSGTNQSNHMYKLGPVHQGVMDRGSKTASGSYLLWPAHIGPFTFVMGRHYKNLDSSSLPFSYLLESNNESVLVPGINLKSVGTIRDAQKWPVRDRRKDKVITDKVNFNMLSPYTVSKMIEGRKLLKKLKTELSKGETSYIYNNMKISSVSLERGIEFYQKGINKFFGNSVLKRLEKGEFSSIAELREILKPVQSAGKGEWVDLAGLIAPKTEVDAFLDKVESGALISIESLSDSFSTMHNSYEEWEWNWTCDTLFAEKGIAVNKITAEDVTGIIGRWVKSVTDLDNLLYEDAGKEFTRSSMTGFGIDGGETEKKLDFKQVRGEFESNSFVTAIQDHIKQKRALADELIARLKRIK